MGAHSAYKPSRVPGYLTVFGISVLLAGLLIAVLLFL